MGTDQAALSKALGVWMREQMRTGGGGKREGDRKVSLINLPFKRRRKKTSK